MKRTATVLLTSIFSAGLYATLATTADARSIGGYQGLPQVYSQTSCFTQSWGAITSSSCTGTPAWETPLVAPNTGTYCPLEYVYNPTANAISCKNCAANPDTGTASCTTFKSLGVGDQTLNPGCVTVNANYYLYNDCLMSNGSVLYNTTF